jgi:putative addiction module component (TIGR02574 family)
MDAKRIIDAALRLPPEVRAALAGDLLASLDDGESEAGRDAEWSAELQMRLQAYERGDVETMPAEDVLAQLRSVARGEHS